MTERELTGFGELQALLGSGTRFDGTLAFEGRVRLDGIVRGKIVGGEVLVLGPSADVDASIEVESLIVRGGTLRGEVIAKRLIEIYAPSRVLASLKTAQLFLDKGVAFEGTCSMLEAPRDSQEPEPSAG
jgi:cytoskeletal protein CcmA (bactofilin family)